MSLDSHRFTCVRTARLACTIGLAGALVMGGALPVPLLSPATAQAATHETLAELNRLQGKVSSAAATYDDAMGKAQDLNAQVAEIADEVIHIEQDLLPARQKRAAEAASDLYKTHSSNGGAISLLLNAGSFADFINLTKYLGTVQNANVAALEDLNTLEDELNGKLDELSQAKDEADAELARASEAYGEAQNAAAALQEKANAEDAAEAEIARKAAEQAAQLQAQQEANKNNGVTGGGTEQQPEGNGPDQSEQGSQNNGPTDNNGSGNTGGGSGNSGNGNTGSGNSGSGESNGSWKTGVASYYGIGDGFMGGTTASGEKVTETSMGIAMLNVPFGTRVEIRYGGRSVIAYVNDRGPYAHGRVIDMQPAVARALNFLSVGVGTVQYRFL